MPRPSTSRAGAPQLGWYLAWLVAAPFAVLGSWYALQVGLGYDSHAYWSAVQHMDHLYDAPALSRDAYLYSPVFAQAVWPLGRLPWPGFAVVWSLMVLAAFIWLLRPLPSRWFLPALAAVIPEVLTGNIYAFMAMALVLGVTRGPAWLFPTLTKITPAVVGVAWLAGARRPRQLAYALLAGAALIGASYAISPGAWSAWFEFLRGGNSLASMTSVPWLLLGLLAAGSALALFAGLTGRAWLLPLAVVLVSPTFGPNTLTLFAALPRMHQRNAGPTSKT